MGLDTWGEAGVEKTPPLAWTEEELLKSPETGVLSGAVSGPPLLISIPSGPITETVRMLTPTVTLARCDEPQSAQPGPSDVRAPLVPLGLPLEFPTPVVPEAEVPVPPKPIIKSIDDRVRVALVDPGRWLIEAAVVAGAPAAGEVEPMDQGESSRRQTCQDRVEPNRKGSCFNCRGPHHYRRCPEPLGVFCFGCGRQFVTFRTCRGCQRKWRARGPRVRRLGYHVPWEVQLATPGRYFGGNRPPPTFEELRRAEEERLLTQLDQLRRTAPPAYRHRPY